MWGLLYQLLYVFLTGAISASSLSLHFRKGLKGSFVGLLALPCFLYLLFAFFTQINRLSALRQLDEEQISSVSYEGHEHQEPAKIHAITEALRQCVWYSRPRHSSLSAESHLLIVRFANGAKWVLTASRYRGGAGTVLEISSGISTGYAFNPVLGHVLDGL
jgi:hypothetical protein